MIYFRAFLPALVIFVISLCLALFNDAFPFKVVYVVVISAICGAVTRILYEYFEGE